MIPHCAQSTDLVLLMTWKEHLGPSPFLFTPGCSNVMILVQFGGGGVFINPKCRAPAHAAEVLAPENLGSQQLLWLGFALHLAFKKLKQDLVTSCP